MEPRHSAGAGLSDAQRRLFEKLTSRRLDIASADIDRLPSNAPVPLNSSQARIWFFGRLYPNTTEYNSFGAIKFAVAPDKTAVEAGLRILMERHDALRLRIIERDEEPLQEECTGLALPFTFHDLSHLTQAEAERQSQQIGSASARAPFRLDQPPLFRISFIHLPAGAALLVFVFHHIIADGWSVSIFCEELTALLAGKPLREKPSLRYLDYIAWQRAHENEEFLERQLQYWEQKLGGELPVLDLPKDRPRQAVQSRKGSIVPCSIFAPLVAELKKLAAQENTTLFAVLLAAYASLLFRLTNQTDLIVGAPFAGRDHRTAEYLVGCFVNSVGLRIDMSGEPTFREVVRRVSATTVEAQDNQFVPFERVVQRLRAPRETRYNPVYQTLFAVQNTPAHFLSYPGAEFSDILLESEAAKFDLTFSLTENRHEISGFMEYSSDLFNHDTVERFVAMYLRLLNALVTDPDCPVSSHSLISAEERQHILYGLNPYKRPDHPYRTMAEPFEEQVERTPDAIALVSDEGSMTYATLNEQANRFACFLRNAGAGPGERVALCMERSFSLIVALYGIAKSGAAYVPLDPELPDGRLAFMLEDTNPSIVLVDSALQTKIPHGPWKLVTMDQDSEHWEDLPASNLPCDGPNHHLIHLLYTSGSTGRPKAVAYPINGALTEIFWLQKSYPFHPGDANIFKTSYGFDVSIWEIFWPLYFGARLVICRPGGHRDPRYLIDMIDKYQVTTIFLIPAMLQAFLDELPPESCRSLRWLICGGEAVTPRLRDTCYAKLACTLVQGYGPTEAGCVTDMIVKPDPRSPVVPLGRPAANYRLYVLDQKLEPVPLGVPGEAYIAGEVGLGQCYYGRPDLTAERFLPDPFGAPGTHMYRTGDICRYRPDGVLEHLGRMGRQIKLRGMRVELGEIEAVLSEYELVENCVAIAFDDEGGQRLAAFIVTHDGSVPDQLMEHAKAMLARYMVPDLILSVPRIPTTLNGKIDRTALIELARAARPTTNDAIAPPQNETELRLREIFSQVLGCDEISVTDSFFDLGGHSLLVFKLISACEQAFGSRPSVADVFSSPSVRELSACLKLVEKQSVGALIPIIASPGKPIVAFIHGASGSAWPFFLVAKQLAPEFATFGLQAVAENGERSIVDLAANYIREIDAVRGLSPVILAGWSMGGCVAMEMARLWRREGVEVAAILLLDTWVPPEGLADANAREEARAAIMAQDILGADEYARFLEPDYLADLDEVLARNRQAFIDYEPAWFDFEVDYLRASQPVPAAADSKDFPEYYARVGRDWKPFVRSVALHIIEGNHYTLVAKEYAVSLAKTIRGIAEARLSFTDI